MKKETFLILTEAYKAIWDKTEELNKIGIDIIEFSDALYGFIEKMFMEEFKENADLIFEFVLDGWDGKIYEEGCDIEKDEPTQTIKSMDELYDYITKETE